LVCSGPATAADEATSGGNAPARPTAGFLNVNESPVGSLLEQRLLADPRAVWLERGAIEALLHEHQLQSLLSAAAADERAKLGRLLKADLLVLLETAAKPNRASIVVCETSYGLRLGSQTVLLGDKPESDVAALEAVVHRALQRRGEKIVEIVAVSPLASRDLSYEYNYLEGAYGKLVEQALSDRPGLLLVELTEARAIARELATAGIGATLRRPMPIYLLGDFRHDGKGEELRVTVRLQGFRGEEKLADREAKLRPGDAPAFLRKAAAELVAASADAPRSPPDPHLEAQRLTDRAVEFQQLDQWQESLALLEAALLLEPSEERHCRAAEACGRLVFGPGELELTADKKKRGRQFYLRGLEHLEEYYRTAGAHTGVERDWRRLATSYPMAGFGLFLADRTDPDAVVALEKERDILFRALRRRVRDGHTDEAWLMQALMRDLSCKERCDLVYRLLVEFQDLPGLRDRLYRYRSGMIDSSFADENEFIARLERSDNPEFREAGAYFRAFLRSAPADRSVGKADMRGPAPSAQAAQFTPIQFPVITPAGEQRMISGLLGCLAAGPRMEIAWDRNHLYAIQSKNNLKELCTFRGATPLVRCVVFDGRYVWAAVRGADNSVLLLLFDPEQLKLHKISAKDGLPLQDKESVPYRQEVMVAPIAPGRACIAGGFGRSWIALATYDPKAAKPVTVDVIHEARRSWDGSAGFGLDPAAAFYPAAIASLADIQAGDAGPRRILIGRCSGGGQDDLGRHLLMADPESRRVSLVSLPKHRWLSSGAPCCLPNYGMHQGAIFFVSAQSDRPVYQLYRIGFPELKPVVFAPDVPDGIPVSGDDGLHIVGRKWWRLRSDGHLDDMGFSPWEYSEHFQGVPSRWVKVNPDARDRRPPLCAICRSRYFGFLAIALNGVGSPQNDDWTTFQVSFHEEKAAPAVLIPDAAARQKAEAEKTIADCTQAINKDPHDVQAYRRRALAYGCNQQFTEGIADAQQAVRLDPQSAPIRNSLGLVRLAAHDFAAIADFTEAIRLNPKFAVAYNNRGAAYLAWLNEGDAAADFSEAIRLDPNYAEAYYGRAKIAYSHVDLEHAIADFTEAIRCNPYLEEAYLDRSWAYQQKKEFQRARSDLAEQKFVEGLKNAARGDMETALESMGQAIQFDERHARAYYQSGLIRQKMGNTAGAAADFAQATRLDLDHAALCPLPPHGDNTSASSESALARYPVRSRRP
jgi:tetratricopeptide (TPR) repeat protein